MTEQPSPWDQPPSTPPAPPPPSGTPWTPPAATPPTGGPAWGPPPGPPWGPPPASRSSTGRTVGIVLGVLSVGAVAFVGLLIGAVTFLGTSSEPEFTPVGSSLPPGEDPYDAPYDEPYDDPYEDPYDEPSEDPAEVDPSDAALDAVSDRLAPDDWVQNDQDIIPAEAPLTASPCAPEGWLTGALDRAIGWYGIAGENVDALTITLVTYETEADAAAELERARTTTYQDCEVLQRRELHRLGSDVEVTVLPEDATAPGVAIAMTETGGAARTEYDQVIVVGRMRAQIDVCSCAEFDLLYLGWVAADVAASLAEQQGLPVPG